MEPDNAIVVAKSLYYWDLRDVDPSHVVMFDELPIRYQLRYLAQADHVIAELTAAR